MVKLKGKFPRLDRLEWDNLGDSVLEFFESNPFYLEHPELRKDFFDYNIYRNPSTSFNAGTLPEVVVTPDPNSTSKVFLNTYYPVISKDYPLTGHSKLITEGGNTIDVMSDDPDYNLVTNNCSDATRRALERATGKKINPWLFTTPGDVKDFAEKELGGKSKSYENSTLTVIELPTKNVKKIAEYSKELEAKRNKKKLVAKNKFGGIVKAQWGSVLVSDLSLKDYSVKSSNPYWKSNIMKSAMEGLDIYHKFGNINFKEFASVMRPIFERVLLKYNYPTSNLNNLVKQSAMESLYGTKTRGSKGYNLGGIKWNGQKDYKYTLADDNQKYVDFDSLYDYADYMVRLLHKDYNALNAKDLEDYTKRLNHHLLYDTSYYGIPQGAYFKEMNGMTSLDKVLNTY